MEAGKRDYSISCARLFAMCFIILSHMMQRDRFATDIFGMHIEWMVWFNVGVQMFLFISGFLYGQKEIETVSFYKKVFPKLLIDYYVFAVAMLLVFGFSPIVDLNFERAFNFLILSNSLPGLGHLWFVPTIMFCYLMTPILSEIFKTMDNKSDLKFLAESLLLLVIVHLSVKSVFRLFDAEWINCFVIGLIYGRLNSRKDRCKQVFNLSAFAICILILPVRFVIDYLYAGYLPDAFSTVYGTFSRYCHVVLGIVLVLLIRFLYKCFEKVNKTQAHPVLDWSDKYSYDVYLVHHVFVNSAFACVEYISNRLIALPLAVLFIIVSAVILRTVSDFIRKLIAHKKVAIEQ